MTTLAEPIIPVLGGLERCPMWARVDTYDAQCERPVGHEGEHRVTLVWMDAAKQEERHA